MTEHKEHPERRHDVNKTLFTMRMPPHIFLMYIFYKKGLIVIKKKKVFIVFIKYRVYVVWFSFQWLDGERTVDAAT